ncbi:hypothetical protein ACVWZV_004480 [Bradyrhizobium sp. GM5.1]
MFERKSRYRNARLKTTRDKTLLRCRLVAPATVPTNKPDPQFLIIVCHHKVSTYFGGHLMHQSTQKQKVQGNSRLLSDAHEGIKAAVSKVLNATCQRCRVHFMRNALAHAGKSGRRVVSAFIATGFAQDVSVALRPI